MGKTRGAGRRKDDSQSNENILLNSLAVNDGNQSQEPAQKKMKIQSTEDDEKSALEVLMEFERLPEVPDFNFASLPVLLDENKMPPNNVVDIADGPRIQEISNPVPISLQTSQTALESAPPAASMKSCVASLTNSVIATPVATQTIASQTIDLENESERSLKQSLIKSKQEYELLFNLYTTLKENMAGAQSAMADYKALHCNQISELNETLKCLLEERTTLNEKLANAPSEGLSLKQHQQLLEQVIRSNSFF
jgi:hypothetical protein